MTEAGGRARRQRRSIGHWRRKQGAQGTGWRSDLRPRREERAGQFRRGAAKDGDDGRAHRRREVHGAGVVCQYQAANFQRRGQLAQGGFAGEIQRRVPGFALRCRARSDRAKSRSAARRQRGPSGIGFSDARPPPPRRNAPAGHRLAGPYSAPGFKPNHGAAPSRARPNLRRTSSICSSADIQARRERLGGSAQGGGQVQIMMDVMGGRRDRRGGAPPAMSRRISRTERLRMGTAWGSGGDGCSQEEITRRAGRRRPAAGCGPATIPGRRAGNWERRGRR